MRVHVLHVPGVDPERDAVVTELREKFDAVVHLDPERKGLMRNWLIALRSGLEDDQEWFISLSDDAKPFASTLEDLPLALANSPRDALGLTHFGGYGNAALNKNVPYGTGRLLIWGGAFAIRSSVLRELATFAHTFYAETGYVHDDGMVALFQAWRGSDTALTSRAIFGQPIAASLIGHNTPIRSPNSTLDMPGPAWDAQPASVPVSRGSSAKFAERMARVLDVMGPYGGS